MITAKEATILTRLTREHLEIPKEVWDEIRKAASNGDETVHWRVPYYNHECYLPMFRRLGYQVASADLDDDPYSDHTTLIICWDSRL